jgi:hypothetical protein
MDTNDINNGTQEHEFFELPEYVEWEEKGETLSISRIERNNRGYQRIIEKLPFEPFKLIGQTILIKIREQVQKIDEHIFYIDAQWVYAQVLSISISTTHHSCGMEFTLNKDIHVQIGLIKPSEIHKGSSSIFSTATIVWFELNFDFSEEKPDLEWNVQIISPKYRDTLFDLDVDVEINS